MASNDTTLVIKNPSRSNQHFSTSFRLDGTIADLQKLLSETYEGRPAPADQTLIYGGKVLKDSSVRLRDIVSKHDAPEGPHSIHLVVKQKPPTIGPSSARSVDSSAAAPASRAGSIVNAGTSGAARQIPPPTRTVPAFGSSSAFGPGPSTVGNTSSSHPGAEPPPAASGDTSQSDPDELDAAASLLNSWTPFPGTAVGGLFGAVLGGSPFALSSVPGTAATEGNSTGQQEGAVAAMPAATMSAYMYYNPIIGGAYQAAYSAALAALSVASQQQLPQEQPGQQAKETVSAAPMKGDEAASSTGDGAAVDFSPSAGTAAAASTTTTSAAVAQQYAYVPIFIPAYGQAGYPLGVPGGLYNMPQQASTNSRRNGQQVPAGWMWPPMPLAAGQQWHQAAGGVGFGAEIEGADFLNLTAFLEALEGRAAAAGGRRQGVRNQEAGANQAQGGAGGGAARDGLRVRRGRLVHLGAMPGNEQQAADAAARNRAGAAPRRPRVFTIRISARALLQALVFAIVLYQHFTWRRFLALLIGGAVLLITSTWAPFRRLMRGIHAIPQRPAAPLGRGDGPADGPPAAAAAAAGGLAGAGGARGGPAGLGDGGPQQPVEQQQQQIQRRGFLYEILVFVVGFITSLLPAWNFNPEDAAAFAAGQEIIAAEERGRQQQQQAAGEREAAPAEGAGGRPAQEGAPAAAAAAVPEQ